MQVTSDGRLEYLLLIREIEDFLYREADLLDERHYEEWVELFSDDVRYWMPMRRNLAFRQRDREITGETAVAWIDDDKLTLVKRVRQILTGVHWAEEPLSRVSHLVSNIRLSKPVTRLPEGDEVEVKCHFLVHRNRLETEEDFIPGRRIDVLRRNGDSFLISRRTIIIDQSVLLAKSLTFFF